MLTVLFSTLIILSLASPIKAQSPTLSPTPTLTPTPTPLPIPTIVPPTTTSPDYQKAQQDYQYQQNQYHDHLSQYQLAKNRYLQFQTLTTKQEALNQTKQFIKTRDLLMKTYFSLLIQKANLTPGLSPSRVARIKNRLQEEINFLDAHREQVDSFATLKDAFASSETFAKRYPQMENLSYETLHLHLTGYQLSFKAQIEGQITTTQTFLSSLKFEKDTTKEERWTLEAQNRLNRHQEKLTQTDAQLQELLKRSYNSQTKRDRFNQISFVFQEANQYLKESVAYLKETLKEVKRG